MEKCRFCGEELTEGQSVCPACGKDNEPAAVNEEPIQEQTAPAAEDAPQAPEKNQEAPQEQPDEAQSAEAAQEQPDEAQSAETPEGKAGETQPETPIREGIKATPGTIALGAAALLLLVAVLAALVFLGTNGSGKSVSGVSEETVIPETTAVQIAETTPATIPADGNPDDVTCKGSYSVSDEEAENTRDVVVATLADRQLTNQQLRVYYWMEVQGFLSNYGYYASYMGLDYTQPLDTQLTMEGDMTWQQFFLDGALNNWRQVQSLALESEKEGLEVSPENQQMLDNMDAQVAEMAQSYEVSVEELLKNNFGPGTGMEEYKYFQRLYYQGLPYYTRQSEKLAADDETLRAYFEAHKEEYASGGLSEDDMYVDVRHILITPEGGTTGTDGTTTYSEEEWEACREKAQNILDAYLTGENTAEAFAALATQNTQDPGSAQTGGLYERVYAGQMVAAFNDWCFDAARQEGDTGLVKTEYGYHVMYFVRSYPQWRYYAEQDWIQEQSNKIITDVVEKYDFTVNFEDIALGVVNMG